MRKLVLLLFVLITNNAFSQEPYTSYLNHYPVSPESAAVMRYADYPVSVATGIPDISIPIYTIKAGSLVFPLELRYHASGLRPNEDSGVIATGWSLNLPSMTRSVNGLPDEMKTVNRTGFMHNTIGGINNHNQEYLRQVVEGKYDEQQDTYYYQLIDDAGRFMLDSKKPHDPKSGYMAVPMPDKYVDISFQPLNTSLISDPYGNYYTFSAKENSIYTLPGNISYTGPSRWLCTSIQPASGTGSISLDYTVEARKTPSGLQSTARTTIEDRTIDTYYSSQKATIKMMGSPNQLYEVTTEGRLVENKSLRPDQIVSGIVHTSLILERYIETISFPLGLIKFEYGGTLQTIRVYDNTDLVNPIKTIRLNVTRYNSNTTLTKLDSVEIWEGNEYKKYTLDYYNSAQVPSQTTRGIDHWGYYNGKGSNSYGVPAGRVSIQYNNPEKSFSLDLPGGDNRESDEAYMKYGALRYLTTPEGVKTEFQYQANKAAFIIVNQNQQIMKCHSKDVGGLCVHSIKVYDSEGVMHKEVFYDYGIHSWAQDKYKNWIDKYSLRGGFAPRVVTVADYCITQIKEYYHQNMSLDRTSRLRTYASNPVSNITFPDGRTVLYSQVLERTKISTPNGTSEKSTIYYYQEPKHLWAAFPDVDYLTLNTTQSLSGNPDLDYILRSVQGNIHHTYLYRSLLGENNEYDPNRSVHPKNKYDYNVGALIKKEEYTADKLTYRESYEYYSEESNKITPYKLRARTNIAYYSPATQRIAVAAGPISPPVSELEKKYEYIKPYGIQFYYGYTPVKTKTMTSYTTGGDSLQIKEHYTYNKQAVHKRPITKTYTNSEGKEVVEHFTYPEDLSTNLQDNMIFRMLEHKKTIGDIISTTSISYYGNMPQTISEKIENRSTGESHERTKANYQYVAGNMVYAEQLGEPNTGYIWSYSNQYPIAQLQNVPYSSFANLASTMSVIRKPTEADYERIEALARRNEGQAALFEYKPLVGVTKIQDHSSRKSSFTYDRAGRLQEQRDDRGSKVASYRYRLTRNSSAEPGPGTSSGPDLTCSFTGMRMEYPDTSLTVYADEQATFYIDIDHEPLRYNCTWTLKEINGSNAGRIVTTYSGLKVVTYSKPSGVTPDATLFSVTCVVKDLDRVLNYDEDTFIFRYDPNPDPNISCSFQGMRWEYLNSPYSLYADDGFEFYIDIKNTPEDYSCKWTLKEMDGSQPGRILLETTKQGDNTISGSSPGITPDVTILTMKCEVWDNTNPDNRGEDTFVLFYSKFPSGELKCNFSEMRQIYPNNSLYLYEDESIIFNINIYNQPLNCSRKWTLREVNGSNPGRTIFSHTETGHNSLSSWNHALSTSDATMLEMTCEVWDNDYPENRGEDTFLFHYSHQPRLTCSFTGMRQQYPDDSMIVSGLSATFYIDIENAPERYKCDWVLLEENGSKAGRYIWSTSINGSNILSGTSPYGITSDCTKLKLVCTVRHESDPGNSDKDTFYFNYRH